MATPVNHGLHQIKLIKNPNFLRDGVKAYGHLLRKYEFTPTIDGPFLLAEQIVQEGEHHLLRRWRNKPDHFHARTRVLKRNDAGEHGEVPAQDVQNDQEYVAPVGIGTNPTQYLNLDFDTGSSDLWVWSTNLPKSYQNHDKHNIYDHTKSPSYKASPGQTWSITYGDGSNASGTVGTDTVNVGGLIIKKQAIELASKLSESFAEDASDGLLGLAWPALNTVKPHAVATPVENMILQSDIPKASELFTAYLTNSHDSIDPCYTFGYIDDNLLAGNTPHYTSVDNSQGFWQISSTVTSINGTSVSSAGNTAVMDTGTTLALIDDNTCSAIYSEIPGAKQDNSVGGWVFPSRIPISSLPAVSVDIGGMPCTIHREDLAYCDAGNSMTYGGIQSRGSLPFNLFGDTVLKSMYAIFNQGEKTFGFVQRPDPGAATASQQDNTQKPLGKRVDSPMSTVADAADPAPAPLAAADPTPVSTDESADEAPSAEPAPIIVVAPKL